MAMLDAQLAGMLVLAGVDPDRRVATELPPLRRSRQVGIDPEASS